MKKQTAALREVNDSRLKIYEQLEVSIQDLERANHRLVIENTSDKKLIKRYVWRLILLWYCYSILSQFIVNANLDKKNFSIHRSMLRNSIGTRFKTPKKEEREGELNGQTVICWQSMFNDRESGSEVRGTSEENRRDKRATWKSAPATIYESIGEQYHTNTHHSLESIGHAG